MLLRRLIGTALRQARLRQGRTLREVAHKARISMPYLSEVERGRKEVSSEILAAICAALGLPLLDLLDDVRGELGYLQAPPPVPVGPRTPTGPRTATHPTPSGTGAPGKPGHSAPAASLSHHRHGTVRNSVSRRAGRLIRHASPILDEPETAALDVLPGQRLAHLERFSGAPCRR